MSKYIIQETESINSRTGAKEKIYLVGIEGEKTDANGFWEFKTREEAEVKVRGLEQKILGNFFFEVIVKNQDETKTFLVRSNTANDAKEIVKERIGYRQIAKYLSLNLIMKVFVVPDYEVQTAIKTCDFNLTNNY